VEARVPAACSASTLAALQRGKNSALRVVPRWSFSVPAWADNRHLFLPEGRQLLVLDVETGQLTTRVPRLDGSSFGALPPGFLARLELVPGKILEQSEQPGCEFGLSVFDANSGALRKTYQATGWSLSADGERLAITQIEALDATARSKRSILIVDARTLAPLETIREPGPSATSSWYDLHADWSIGDGESLVVRWANAVSVTDFHSGKTWQFPLAQPAHDFKGRSREAGRIAWRVDDRISIWDSHAKQLRSFEATGCSKGYGVALSPDGARVAVGCTKSVAIWDAGSEQLIQRIALAYDTWNPSWLSGGRGLVVETAEWGHWDVLDSVTGRTITVAQAGQGIAAVGRKSRLFALEWSSSTRSYSRLVYLDAALTAHDVPTPDCEIYARQLVEGEDGMAALWCRNKDGPKALVVDTNTLHTQTLAMSGEALAIRGHELIGIGSSIVDLRALQTGALWPGAPVTPLGIGPDSWWEAETLVTAVPGETTRRISHFGNALSASTEPIVEARACSGEGTGEHEGLAWQNYPPYLVCDRRTGRAVAEVPAKALFPPGVYESADPPGEPQIQFEFAPGGALILTSYLNPRLFRRKDRKLVRLVDPPPGAHFVGPRLIAGSDSHRQFGVWDGATGKRIARWSQDKTPGYDPIHHDYSSSPERPLAADANLGLVVFEPINGNVGPTLRDLASGKVLEEIPVFASDRIRFVAPGVLSVMEPARVSFWRVPHAKRLGIWLSHPRSVEAAFLAESGQFEISGDLGTWRDVLRCEQGLAELPLETCANTLLEPGIAARTLGFTVKAPK
jgi:hypothetical protein